MHSFVIISAGLDKIVLSLASPSPNPGTDLLCVPYRHRSSSVRTSDARNASVLAPPLDSLVTVLVQASKVMPQLAVLRVDGLPLLFVHLREPCKLLCESPKSSGMKFVLM